MSDKGTWLGIRPAEAIQSKRRVCRGTYRQDKADDEYAWRKGAKVWIARDRDNGVKVQLELKYSLKCATMHNGCSHTRPNTPRTYVNSSPKNERSFSYRPLSVGNCQATKMRLDLPYNACFTYNSRPFLVYKGCLVLSKLTLLIIPSSSLPHNTGWQAPASS